MNGYNMRIKWMEESRKSIAGLQITKSDVLPAWMFIESRRSTTSALELTVYLYNALMEGELPELEPDAVAEEMVGFRSMAAACYTK